MKSAKVVFLGGGHANVLAMLHLAKHIEGKTPRPLLISEDKHSPYSGMLPGYIAGHYRREQCFINLASLAHRCGFDFLPARAAGINADDKTITLEDGGIAGYDVLSVNIGSIRRPPFLSADVCIIKPIDAFVKRLAQTKPPTTIIGAGAAGVEVALSMPPQKLTIIGRRLLPHYPPMVQDGIMQLLKQRGINFVKKNITGEKCINDINHNKPGRIIVATGAAPSPLLANSGAKTTNGWLHINPCLQSITHDNIFAAGDCAHCDDWQVQKSGVVAVRQSSVLARNIMAKMNGKPLTAWQPPRRFLAILGDGAGAAFAVYGKHYYYGKAALTLKRFLDSRFMDKVGGYS